MKHRKRNAMFPLLMGASAYCTADGKRKRKYKTELDAELSAPASDLGQYICIVCGFWHNGSSTRRASAKPAPRGRRSPKRGR